MIRPWERRDAQAFADGLSGNGPSDAQIDELVRFAEGLCDAATVEPSAAFTDDLRATLMREAESVLTAPIIRPQRSGSTMPQQTRQPVRRRLVALSTTLVISAGGVGLVASSASALPGEMLYPVKKTVESVELAIHRGEVDHATFELELASERLSEAQSLVTSNEPVDDRLVASTLQDFAQRAHSGSTTLLADDSTGSAGTQRVQDFTSSSNAKLRDIESLIPAAASESFEDASQTIVQLAERVTDRCSDCSTQSTESLRSIVQNTVGALINSSVDQRAVTPPTPVKASQTPLGPTLPPESKSPVVPQPAAETTEPSPGLLDPVTGLLLGDPDENSSPGLIPGLLGILVGD